MLRKFIAYLCITLSFATAHFSMVAADAPLDLGIPVGSSLPTDITAKDQFNTQRNFDDLVGDKGLVLVFFRSASWCPYCQLQLVDLQINAQKPLKDLGYSLAAISYDSVDDLDMFQQKWAISYPLLADEGSKIIRAFDIFNDDYKKGSRAYGVPYPIIYVVSPAGVVTHKLFEANYRKRPSVKSILETLTPKSTD